MKKWIVWLKKNSPWIFLLIGPVLNFYLLEWYTHKPDIHTFSHFAGRFPHSFLRRMRFLQACSGSVCPYLFRI